MDNAPIEYPETSTLAEFADIAGFRRSYITQLKQDGRLVLDGRRVIIAASLARIAETRDPAKAGVVARHAAARAAPGKGRGNGAQVPASPGSAAPRAKAPVAPMAPVSPATATTQVGATYQVSRAVRERYMALEAKRAYDVAIGKLMVAAEVEGVVANVITTLRSRLEALQDVLTPLLATISDEAQIRATLSAEVEHALTEAARHFKKLKKGSEDARA